jgi:RNA polymerase primary sigma factor
MNVYCLIKERLYMAKMNMLRSDLSERMLMQETGVGSVAQEGTAVIQKIATGTETGNFEYARKLEYVKLKLIESLARFPVTALWIIKKYEQNIENLDTEFTDTLKNFKKHHAITGLSLSKDSQEEQAFIKAFKTFPFSFEDLIELTDLVVYIFQIRERACQATKYQLKKPPDCWFIKRLQNLERVNRLALFEKFKALQIPNDGLVSDELLYQYVFESVRAEHFWLQARQRLVENNARLVLFIANQYKGGFLDFDDLVQEGQTGLLAAVDKFDYHVGCQFSTYAAYWIRQRISRALSRNERIVRVPCEQVSNIGKLFRAKEELLLTTGKEPSVQELVDYLKMSYDEVNAMLSISQTALPLESFDNEDEVSSAPIDVIEQQVFQPALNEMAQSELQSWLKLAIKTLNSRESRVIRCHFGIDTESEMTLQEIGAELNISRERVRQIQVMAFNKMKLNYGEQLVSFL